METSTRSRGVSDIPRAMWSIPSISACSVKHAPRGLSVLPEVSLTIAVPGGGGGGDPPSRRVRRTGPSSASPPSSGLRWRIHEAPMRRQTSSVAEGRWLSSTVSTAASSERRAKKSPGKESVLPAASATSERGAIPARRRRDAPASTRFPRAENVSACRSPSERSASSPPRSRTCRARASTIGE